MLTFEIIAVALMSLGVVGSLYITGKALYHGADFMIGAIQLSFRPTMLAFSLACIALWVGAALYFGAYFFAYSVIALAVIQYGTNGFYLLAHKRIVHFFAVL